MTAQELRTLSGHRTTTFPCLLNECQNCHSTRTTRGVGEYAIIGDEHHLINCSDCNAPRETSNVDRNCQPVRTARKETETLTRDEARKRLQNSSLRFLVPSNFEVRSNRTVIFPATPAFWKRWRVDRNWLGDIGVQPFPSAFKPRKVWSVQVNMLMLDELTQCETCRTPIDIRYRQCDNCYNATQ